MPIVHECVGQAVENVANIRAGEYYACIPGRRTCIEHPGQACPLGDVGCGAYTNRGTSRFAGYGTFDFFEDAAFLLKLPSNWAYEYGCFVEPLSVAVHAIRAALELKVLPVDRVAVLGLGGLGIMLTGLLVDLGIEVFAYDLYSTGVRRQALDTLGSKAIFVENLSHIDNSFPVVFDMAGGTESLADCVRLAVMGGTVLAGGIPMVDADKPVYRTIVTKGLTVKGIVSAHWKHDYGQAVTALTQWFHNRRDFMELICTHRIPASRFEEVLKVDPKDRLKVVLTLGDN